MNAPALEVYLVLLYTNEAARVAFLADPRAAALRHGLSPEQADALATIDRAGLQMAARSFAAKRTSHGAHLVRVSLRQRLRCALRRAVGKR